MATQLSMNSLRTSMMFEENRWFFKKINEKSKCQRGNQWSLQKKIHGFRRKSMTSQGIRWKIEASTRKSMNSLRKSMIFEESDEILKQIHENIKASTRKSMNSVRKSMMLEDNLWNPWGNQWTIKASTRISMNSLRESMIFE